MISAFNYSASTVLFLILNRRHKLALATPNNSCCFDFQHLVDGHILQAWLFGWTAALYNQGIKWLSGLLLDQMHHGWYKKGWQKRPWWYTLHTHTHTHTQACARTHTKKCFTCKFKNGPFNSLQIRVRLCGCPSSQQAPFYALLAFWRRGCHPLMMARSVLEPFPPGPPAVSLRLGEDPCGALGASLAANMVSNYTQAQHLGPVQKYYRKVVTVLSMSLYSHSLQVC